MKASKELSNMASTYGEMSAEEKEEFIKEAYLEEKMSWKAIAELCGTYPQKIRRDAIRLGIKSRSKSSAQKLALESGRHPHPTKDKERTEEEKFKISESMHKVWKDMDEDERERRREISKEIWNNKSPEEIREIREAAGKAVRKAAKEGSALEMYLFEHLLKKGYKVDFHKEHFLIRDRQQIDIFLPAMNVAIEVDGPSHFNPIWGDEVLAKNKERDRMKTGLILQKGLCIIRIRQRKALSQKYKRDILNRLFEELEKISQKFPEEGRRNIIIDEV